MLVVIHDFIKFVQLFNYTNSKKINNFILYMICTRCWEYPNLIVSIYLVLPTFQNPRSLKAYTTLQIKPGFLQIPALFVQGRQHSEKFTA